MKDWNEYANVSRKTDKKIYKSLSLSQKPLNILLKNLHWETHIDFFYLHFRIREF